MKDFPFFTTVNGVASLVFKEIPYSGIAYVTIRDSVEPERLLDECIAFCKAVGAKKIYASGNPFLNRYPLHTYIYEMSLPIESIEEVTASLQTVTEQTINVFRDFYNQKMSTVPNAGYMTNEDAKKIAESGKGYFVYSDGQFLGILIASPDRLEAIAANIPGCGETLVRCSRKIIEADSILLDVASSNIPAMKLYERMGFVKSKCLNTWYKILEDVK